MALKRVHLRPLQANDVSKIVTWRNKKNIRKGFFDSRKLNLRKQKAWYASYTKRTDDEMFIIQVGDKDVGAIAIYNIDTKKKKAEIGRLMIGEDAYRSKGYAYRAGRLLLTYAFCTLKMRRLSLAVFADNKPALNVYKKLGFAEEEVLRKHIKTARGRKDVIVMGLLKEHFK